MGENESFFLAKTLLGEVWGGGGRQDEPKAEQKIVLRSREAESHGTIAWKGFFTQSQVLLSSIVEIESEPRAPNVNFRKISCKRLACLPLLGFFEHLLNGKIDHF